MNLVVATALFGYFETLYDFNRNLIALCGLDVLNSLGHYEKYIKDAIQAVPRLVPYGKGKGEEKYIIKMTDGLLEFSDELPFLKQDYEELLNKHYSLLADIKAVRNKFEHKMHGAQLTYGMSNDAQVEFELRYSIGGNSFKFSAQSLIAFAKDINSMFAKIQEQLVWFCNDSNNFSHQYYRQLLRVPFRDFNKIYESDILNIIGRISYPF